MKLKRTMVVLLVTLIATACASPEAPSQDPTPDIAAVRTSAAGTVIAQFTLTAAAFTPTPAQPTETATPEVTGTVTSSTATGAFAQVTDASGTTIALCDSLEFVADVNVPDDTDMSPGQDFLKTWRVRNAGSCPWGQGYELVYAGYANEMSGQPQPLTQVVQPGQEVEVSVQFTAPEAIGEYLSAWQMSNPAGVTFEQIIFVRIIVQ
ncbi:MAG TPA: NBR1-Ig-like domain-containing protein [Anaerolineales bacterium]|nr:NBR1-Ig-like domain-containing protein [Anaerolineales bacterium]